MPQLTRLLSLFQRNGETPMKLLCTAAIAALALSGAQAATLSVTSAAAPKNGFVSASGLIPIAGSSLSSITLQDVTISSLSSNSLNFQRDWTAEIDGVQWAINGVESFNLSFASATKAFGFDFIEVENGPFVNAAFVDSVFEITLCDGTDCFDSVTLDVANDIGFFVAVSSARAFDSVQVRETTGNIENEFFGEIFVQAVPVPAAAPLFGAGLALAAWRRRRG